MIPIIRSFEIIFKHPHAEEERKPLLPIFVHKSDPPDIHIVQRVGSFDIAGRKQSIDQAGNTDIFIACLFMCFM